MADHIQIGDISPRIQYTGDGVQTVFTYPFPIFSDADMAAFEDTTLKTLTTHFTVSGAGNSNGGSVTFITAPANGVTVTLKRQLAIQRTSDFQESGEFRSKVINDELDTLTAALQQVDDEVSRSLRLSSTDSANSLNLPDKAARASMYLGFDANGDPIATDAKGPQGPTGPAGNMDGANNLSELTNVGTARTTLGLGTAAIENVAAGGIGDLLRADGDGSNLTGTGGASDAEKANIILNAFRISVNGGLTVQNMVDGVVDEFEDETGVDLPTSTNETYSAGSDLYSNLALVSSVAAHWEGGTGDVTFGTGTLARTGGASAIRSKGSTPITFTGDFEVQWTVTSIAGQTVYFGIYPISEDATFSASGDASGSMTAMTDSWSIHTDSATITNIKHGSVIKATPADLVNNDVVLFKRSGDTISISINSTVAHTFAETSTAELRMVFAGNVAWSIDTLTYPLGATNMTLVSNATSALATPTDAFIVLWQEDVDAVTLNTDLKAYASRDGGTTWTQITLTEEATLSTGRILTGSVDISGQPSGTSMKYKIETLNTKEQKIHGVGLQWS